VRPKGWQLEARKVKSGGWGFGEGSSERSNPSHQVGGLGSAVGSPTSSGAEIGRPKVFLYSNYSEWPLRHLELFLLVSDDSNPTNPTPSVLPRTPSVSPPPPSHQYATARTDRKQDERMSVPPSQSVTLSVSTAETKAKQILQTTVRCSGDNKRRRLRSARIRRAVQTKAVFRVSVEPSYLVALSCINFNNSRHRDSTSVS